MAEFKLGRIRFVWKSDWATGTTYYKDDVVKYGGKVFICITGHAASADFYTDLDAIPSKWNQLSDGFTWENDWAVGTTYKTNDMVKYGGRLYVCRIPHTSAATLASGLEADLNLADSTLSKWDNVADGIDWKGTWTVSTRYKVNDVVKYGGINYICNTYHTSAASISLGLETDLGKWDVFNRGIEYRDAWTALTRYRVNDVVKYGGTLYICTLLHTSTSNFGVDINNWSSFVEGLQFENTWSSATSYQPGDIVRYGGNQYVATTVNLAAVPSTSTANWDLFSKGFSFTTDWSNATSYKVGEVVRLNGYTYLCILDHSGQTPPSATYWTRLNSGVLWKGEWANSTAYYLGDAVRYMSNVYICVQNHTSNDDDSTTFTDSTRSPSGDTEGVYWNIFNVGNEYAVMTNPGDMVYYNGDQGPARLPIGIEGQVLKVTSSGNPDWDYLGVVDQNYYVGNHGVDLPAPIHGRTSDKPWKTVRYALEQIEKGPRNPAAQRLLEMNRVFIQREVTEWIARQIISNASPFTTSFVYDEFKCERDVGFVVDRIIHDIGHGGNLKTLAAALSYINALDGGILFATAFDENGTGTYSRLAEQKDEDVAAYNYMLTVIGNVLNNQAPQVNYQVLNGDNSTAIVPQFIDADLVAETGVLATITDLVGIVTTALTDGNTTNLPDRTVPASLLNVKTGSYSETLPMIVPTDVCVLGDEKRAVTVSAAGSLIDISDAYYTVDTFNHVQSIVEDIVTGTTITRTTGNSLDQSINAPFSDATQATVTGRLVKLMKQQADFKLGTMHLASLTDPTGYNVSYLAGYGNARKLIKENKKFFQEEVVAYMVATYPTLSYGKVKTRRDAGYIVDAVIYDLTYGGNALSVKAGLAYYDGDDNTQPQLPTSIKAPTLAALAFLKDRLQAIAVNTPVTPLQTTVVQFRGTAGAAGTATFVGARLDEIITIINTGPSAVGTTVTLTDPTPANGVNSTTALISAYSTLSSANETIVTNVVDYLNTNFGSFRYNSAFCRRDSGYLVDAAYYDAAFGSNFWAVQNGLSYLRSQAGEVTANQLDQEIGSINYIKGRVAASVASDATAVSRANAAYVEIVDIIENGVANADALVYTSTGTANFTNARAQLVTNRAFIISTMVTWLTANVPGYVALSAAKKLLCQRDLGYAIDALAYDVNYGGNIATRNFCRSLFNNITGVGIESVNSGTTYTQLGVITAQIVRETYAGQDTSGTAASATEATRMTTLCGNISTVATAGNLSGLVAESLPSITWASAGIQTALGTLATDKTDIVKDTLQYISDNYSDFTYNHAKAERDATIVLKAVGYDFMFNTNYQSIKAAHAYLRLTASELFDQSTIIKQVTLASLEYTRTQAIANVGSNATAIARINTLMDDVYAIVYSGSREGDMCQTVERNKDYAALQLERNRDFIVAEVSAYIADTYTDTVTAATAATDVFTCSDTSWMKRNVAVRFTGTTFGGVTAGTTYYIQDVVSSTTFKIATTRNTATALDISANASGSMTVALYYNTELCARDVGTYIDALKWDLKYTSNYKSMFVARYYANAVTGSQEEDMYYLRNGTGLRNMTLRGLEGDLTPPNAYGTSRVTSGAYASLDPGWGPADFRTWITARSPYIQNCATFGNAAIGQKIDGSLHNGGNKSFVSNDFTQLISDGIGAWVTNNARAELVSVFSYYSHIGYLSENGGRIRGTNGNNSYGDFGSVAEGFDATETTKTAIVDNRYQYKSVVGTVTTDSDAIYRYEFDHAGNEYTEAAWLLIGPGNNAIAYQDEFRDDAVYQVRMIDNVDDSTAAPEADGNQGGFGYVTNTGTAQNGSSTTITLSATDNQLSTAYIGMVLHITSGNGIGQYAIINTYDAGTKIAAVIKETTGAGGWDHQVPGTTIVSPDSSSSYLIEPRISFTSPTYSAAATTLPTSGAWTAVAYGNTATTYTSVTGTYSGAGLSASFMVVRNGSKYQVTVQAGGTGYTRLETITILGTSVGGLAPTNNITVTITSVNSVTGAIQAVDFEGYGLGGRFVAVRSGSIIGATSEDGTSWTTRTSLMPSGAAWKALAFGQFEDGSSVNRSTRFVAVAGTSANTTGAYSEDGITWSSSTMVTSATWVDVAYGEGRFVAIASDTTTVRISLDGETWDLTGALPATGFTAITYGMGLFVAVKSGGTAAASSVDGVTWISRTLPSSSAWNAVSWGNGRFVAISNTAGSTVAAYSLNGTSWTASTLPASATWTKIAYGQGMFYAVSTTTQAASSPDGVHWTSRTTGAAASGFAAITHGNPQRIGSFAAVGAGTGTVAGQVFCGATTKARAYVSSEKIAIIRIVEPGSGYASAPTITITDPNNIYEAPTTVRLGDGVLANPSFVNRGTGYQTCSAEIDTGDGYADFFQDGAYVAVRRISSRPAPGANLVFAGSDITYKVVSVVSFRGEYDGAYTAFFQVSPILKVSDNLANGTAITTRIRYSQVRLTGHDFLDIGTGGVGTTNYPDHPTQAPVQANEAVESNGGRVFFTSTDQDGNFRVGDLFTIEQSTGIATLNADAFNISGLQELSLGNLSLGGASAAITEFSTDPFFTADSDSVVPTQRAIKAYIASQIGGGGASLIVNSVTAGDILIGTNQITNVTGGTINFNATVNFTGGLTGSPLALSYFLN